MSKSKLSCQCLEWKTFMFSFQSVKPVTHLNPTAVFGALKCLSVYFYL